ncbi:hypothetical protein AB0F15_17025 [Amycolatopsis sp. NPDC026612]|uniref:hypothetical protein n=1 Tax=Amycolatopsis sp. NPDC026612 TaxID=3155466 RepID=UPI0033C7FB41
MTTRANPLPAPRRGRPARTAIVRATGRHRTFLIATCVALVLAAIADEATGYDGPGPFVYPAFAVLVALVPWRFTPLLVVLMSALFVFGGLASPEFVRRLTTPGRALDFASAWLQLLGFAAAAGFAVAAVVVSRRTPGSRS